MPSFFASAAALALAATALAAPAPQVTQAASLDKRAGSCTFSGSTGAAAVAKSKASCATITLSNVAVPSGTTLDLTKLTKGTKVIFEGTTSFGYKEWAGPLISVSGDSLTVRPQSTVRLSATTLHPNPPVHTTRHTSRSKAEDYLSHCATLSVTAGLLEKLLLQAVFQTGRCIATERAGQRFSLLWSP